MTTASVEIAHTLRPQPPPKPAFFDQGPADMVASATALSAVLCDVIEKQKLYVTMNGGSKYVTHEGWATMGSMLGVLPREKSVTELKDGSYEAVVELYALKSGQVIGQGSALCSVTEKRWGKAEKYARRSMAITRATGKAYRLGLSWVMCLAGYQPTPAEEMPEQPKPKPIFDYDQHWPHIIKICNMTGDEPYIDLMLEALQGHRIDKDEVKNIQHKAANDHLARTIEAELATDIANEHPELREEQ